MRSTRGYSGLVSGIFRSRECVVADSGAEFPERPGALGNFLKGMKPDWNISLFHYRNHGAGVYSTHNETEPALILLRCWEDPCWNSSPPRGGRGFRRLPRSIGIPIRRGDAESGLRQLLVCTRVLEWARRPGSWWDRSD